MKPYYEDDAVTLYHGDCRKLLSDLPAPHLLLTDPPYGIGLQTNYGARKRTALARSNDHGVGIVGDDEPFDPAHLLSYPRAVLFGANHYADRLPSSPSWIVWDKVDGLTSKRDVGFNDQADVELIWTNCGGPARIVRHRWMGLMKASERDEPRVHATQKPVALMHTLISWLTAPGDLILDLYAGSGPVLLAARNLGRRAVGVEIEERHCETIAKRLSQGDLFGGAA